MGTRCPIARRRARAPPRFEHAAWIAAAIQAHVAENTAQHGALVEDEPPG